MKEYSAIYVRGKMVFTTTVHFVHKSIYKSRYQAILSAAGPKNVQSVKVQEYVKRGLYVSKKDLEK